MSIIGAVGRRQSTGLVLGKPQACPAEPPIQPLLHLQCEWGLVECLPNGRLRARPLHEALVVLDSVWDSMFDFGVGDKEGDEGGSVSGTPAGAGEETPAPARRAASSSCCSSSGPPGTAPLSAAGESTGDEACTDQAEQAEQADGDAAMAFPPCQLSAVPEGDEAAGAWTIEAEQQPAEALPAFLDSSEEEQQEIDGQPSAVAEGAEAAAAWSIEEQAAQPLPAVAEGAETATVWDSEEQQRLAAEPLLAALEEVGAVSSDGFEEEQAAALPAVAWVDAPAEAPAGLMEEGSDSAAREPTPEPSSPSLTPRSSSSLEWFLRVPSPTVGGKNAAPAPAGSPACRRSSSARLSPAQLRHLESLRRQRLVQEPEALECLPSSLRLRSTAAAPSPAAEVHAADKPAWDCAMAGTLGWEAGGQHWGGAEAHAAYKRAQGSPGSGGRAGRTVRVSVRVGRRSP